MSFVESHLLTLVIFLPVLGAVLIALLPRSEGGQQKGIAFLFSLLTFLISIPLWTGFRAGSGRYAFEQRTEWAPALGFSYHVGLDGVALLLFLLTTFLGPLVVLSSWKYIQERVSLYCIALLLLETAMLGTLGALDLVLFYVFWEAMLIPMYLLIGVWGSERRIYAAVKFGVWGSERRIYAAVKFFLRGLGADAPRHLLAVEQRRAEELRLRRPAQRRPGGSVDAELAVPRLCLGFRHQGAGVAAAHLASGCAHRGARGGVDHPRRRHAQDGHVRLRPVRDAPLPAGGAVLGVIGIIYGSLMCMAQTDMKRLIAYSSVAHLGFVMLGLSALTPEAVSGAVLQMVNHGISTGALFMMVGFLYERTHTRDLSAYGGVAKVAPAIAATFLVVTLSSIGLPGTNGFVGEFLVLIGTYASRTIGGAPLAVAGATGVVLGAVYMLWMYQRVFFGPPHKAAGHGIPDLTVREWFTLAPILLAIVAIGFAPQPLLSVMKDPVDAFVQRVSRPPPIRKAEVER